MKCFLVHLLQIHRDYPHFCLYSWSVLFLYNLFPCDPISNSDCNTLQMSCLLATCHLRVYLSPCCRQFSLHLICLSCPVPCHSHLCLLDHSCHVWDTLLLSGPRCPQLRQTPFCPLRLPTSIASGFELDCRASRNVSISDRTAAQPGKRVRLR